MGPCCSVARFVNARTASRRTWGPWVSEARRKVYVRPVLMGVRVMSAGPGTQARKKEVAMWIAWGWSRGARGGCVRMWFAEEERRMAVR